MGVFGQIVAGFSLVVGIMQMITGITAIVENWKADWCELVKLRNIANPDFADAGCVGPLLVWNEGKMGFTADNNGPPGFSLLGDPVNWRGFFTFEPDSFLEVWTPVVFGILSVSLHFGHTRWDAISGNWLIFMAYQLVQALFGSIGYSGNLGVITGFMGFLACLLCVIAAWVDPMADRCLDLHNMIPCLRGHAVSPRAKADDEEGA